MQKTHFTYHGRSMWPCFQERDILEILPTDIVKIRKGDCIVFHTVERLTAVHRVTAVQDSLTTRGDALPAVDAETVKPEQVIGKVIRRYRLGRSTSVAGGCLGTIAGVFYRYAGRIDPQRVARGGRLARTIRQVTMFGLALARYTGRPRKLVRNKQPLTVWMFGNTAIARQNPRTEEWTVSWPWSVVVSIPKGSKGVSSAGEQC